MSAKRKSYDNGHRQGRLCAFHASQIGLESSPLIFARGLMDWHEQCADWHGHLHSMSVTDILETLARLAGEANPKMISYYLFGRAFLRRKPSRERLVGFLDGYLDMCCCTPWESMLTSAEYQEN